MNAVRPDETDRRDEVPARPLTVVMGVSGVGKTTVGQLLARRLDVPFADADEFHPQQNIAKMASGIPLTDDDRAPWLAAVGRWLAGHRGTGAVVTCSALRRRYRDALRDEAPETVFLFLDADEAVVGRRVTERPHHFMPVSLLDSQFETLEPPAPDERAVTVDATESPDAIVDAFVSALGLR